MAIRSVDVVIVGAGLSGLMAAQQLQRGGLRVQLLEASHGVGDGCAAPPPARELWWISVANGVGRPITVWPLWWTSLALSATPAITQAMGCWCGKGNGSRPPGRQPRGHPALFDPAALNLAPDTWEACQRLQRRFLELVGRIDRQRPWLTPDAERLDRISVAAWAAAETQAPMASLPLSWLCRVGGSGGFEPWEASILHLAWTQAVAPQLDSPEAWLVRGGAGAIAQRLAEQLQTADRGCILLQAPVRLIRQDSRGVEVSTDFGLVYRAQAAVVAVPPAASGNPL